MRQRAECTHAMPALQELHQLMNTASGCQRALARLPEAEIKRLSDSYHRHFGASIRLKRGVERDFGRNFICFCAQLFTASLCVKFAFRQRYVSEKKSLTHPFKLNVLANLWSF